jgi:hypothetical protein
MGSQKRSRRDGKKKFCPPPLTGSRTPILGSTPQPSYYIEIDIKDTSEFSADKIGIATYLDGFTGYSLKITFQRHILAVTLLGYTAYFDMENPIRSKP